MRKIIILFCLAITVSLLSGCAKEAIDQTAQTVNEASLRITYATDILKEVPSLTGAYTGLQSLYTNPIAHLTDWKKQFDKHSASIEKSYGRIKKLTPPPEFEKSHNLLLTTLETTIKVNDTTNSAIEAGGKVTVSMKNQFESANRSFQTLVKKLNTLNEWK